jgi:hypothetical protein
MVILRRSSFHWVGPDEMNSSSLNPNKKERKIGKPESELEGKAGLWYWLPLRDGSILGRGKRNCAAHSASTWMTGSLTRA